MGSIAREIFIFIIISIITAVFFVPARASELSDAIKTSNNDLISKLIKNKPELINGNDKDTCLPPLFTAVESLNAFAVELLLINGADVNAKNSSGINALSFTLNMLKNPGNFVILPDTGERTMIGKSGRVISIARMLISYCKNFKLMIADDESMFINALFSNDEILISEFIKNGAGLNFKVNNGNKAMIIELFENAPVNVLKQLVENKVNLSAGGWNYDLIIKLIRSKKYEKAKLLINVCDNMNFIDENTGESLLETLVLQKADIELIKFVVSKGADVNYKNKLKDMPLIMAAIDADCPVDSIRYLMKSGADINKKDNFGRTPLLMAAGEKKRADILKLLIDFGADVNYQNESTGINVLMTMIKSGYPAADVEYIIRKGANVNYNDHMHNSVLMVALKNNPNPEIIELLVKNGTDASVESYNTIPYDENDDSKGFYNETALTIAKSLNNTAAIELLNRPENETVEFLKAGFKADFEKMEKIILKSSESRRKCRLKDFICGYMNNLESGEIKLLLKQGVDIFNSFSNVIDDSLTRALEQKNHNVSLTLAIALPSLKLNILNMFIQPISKYFGFNGGLFANNMNYDSYFKKAVEMGDRLLIEKIMQKGVNPYKKFADGETALIYAVKCGVSDDIIEWFLKLGMDIDECGSNEETALIAAVKYNYQDMVDYLISRGADVNLKTKSGNSAVKAALASKNTALAFKLSSNCAGYDYGEPEINEFLFTKAILDNNTSEIAALIKKGVIKPAKILAANHEPLISAVLKGNFELIKELHRNGVSLDFSFKKRESCILGYDRGYGYCDIEENICDAVLNSSASSARKCDMLRFLHKNGVRLKNKEFKVRTNLDDDPFLQMFDYEGKTDETYLIDFPHISPKKIIDSENSLPLVEFLIENGIGVNSRFSNYETLLMAASACDLKKGAIALYLIRHSANVNLKDFSGNTALMRAADSPGINAAFETLLKHGADVKIVNKENENVLFQAMRYSKVELDFIKKLVECGADFNLKNKNDREIISLALNNDRSDILNYLLNKGAKVPLNTEYNRRDYYCYKYRAGDDTGVAELLSRSDFKETISDYCPSFLHHAISNKRNKMAKILINAGVSLEFNDMNHRLNSFFIAVRDNNIEMIDYIVSVYKKRKMKIPPQSLFIAAQNKNFYVMKLLLKSGVDINGTDEYGYNVLNYLSYHAFDRAVFDFLIENGADINHLSQAKVTPLINAAQKNDNAAVEYLIAKKAAINACDNNGMTALKYAAEFKSYGLIKFLISKGAIGNYNDKKFAGDMLETFIRSGTTDEIQISFEKLRQIPGVTSEDLNPYLLKAFESGNFEAVKLLVSQGCDPGYVKSLKPACIFNVIKHGNAQMLKYMVENGFDIKISDGNGENTLMAACRQGDFEMIKFLADKGIDIKVVEKEHGMNLLMIAIRSNPEYGLVKFIIEKGLWPDATDCDGKNSLMTALTAVEYHGCMGRSYHINPAVIELLIKNGADVNRKDRFGMTPLKLAESVRTEHLTKYATEKYPAEPKKLIELLKKYGAQK